MPSKRQRRVADQLREIISELLQFEAQDPRLEGVTVMDVTIDRELEVAKVYVNSLRGEEARHEVVSALDSASGFLRRELGKRIRLQSTPELRFQWDESLSEADKIEALLKSIHIPPALESSEAVDELD
jgi:ribosome-binding factor A